MATLILNLLDAPLLHDYYQLSPVGGGEGKGGSSAEFGCVTVKFTQFPRKVLYYSNDPSLLIGSGNHVSPKLLCPSLPPPSPSWIITDP